MHCTDGGDGNSGGEEGDKDETRRGVGVGETRKRGWSGRHTRQQTHVCIPTCTYTHVDTHVEPPSVLFSYKSFTCI